MLFAAVECRERAFYVTFPRKPSPASRWMGRLFVLVLLVGWSNFSPGRELILSLILGSCAQQNNAATPLCTKASFTPTYSMYIPPAISYSGPHALPEFTRLPVFALQGTHRLPPSRSPINDTRILRRLHRPILHLLRPVANRDSGRNLARRAGVHREIRKPWPCSAFRRLVWPPRIRHGNDVHHNLEDLIREGRRGIQLEDFGRWCRRCAAAC